MQIVLNEEAEISDNYATNINFHYFVTPFSTISQVLLFKKRYTYFVILYYKYFAIFNLYLNFNKKYKLNLQYPQMYLRIFLLDTINFNE